MSYTAYKDIKLKQYQRYIYRRYADIDDVFVYSVIYREEKCEMELKKKTSRIEEDVTKLLFSEGFF